MLARNLQLDAGLAIQTMVPVLPGPIQDITVLQEHIQALLPAGVPASHLQTLLY